jgi:transposase
MLSGQRPQRIVASQCVLMLHRVRLMLNRQRTQISNALRAHLSEFGIVALIGRNGMEQLLVVINDESDTRVPADARLYLPALTAAGERRRTGSHEKGRPFEAAIRHVRIWS